MDACVYQAIKRIIDTSSISNKWLRWCEQSLPDQSVYVPSIFQMRDAFSHVITMFGQGIIEQGLAEEEDPTKCLDEVQLFTSDSTREQLHAVEEHVFRSFFDVADYIVESLAELSMNSTDATQPNNTYLTLRVALTKYNAEISDLRSKKSNPPEASFSVAERWDAVLQVLTSVYSFANYEQKLASSYQNAFDLALQIETKFSTDDILRYDNEFYNKKLLALELKKLPVGYSRFNSHDVSDKIIIDDPSGWQEEVVNEFQSKMGQLDEMKNHFDKLLVAMPSTALLKQLQTGKNTLFRVLTFIASLVVSTVITGIISSLLFIPSTPITINIQFIIKLCAIFIAIELVILVLIWLVSWIIAKLFKMMRTHVH